MHDVLGYFLKMRLFNSMALKLISVILHLPCNPDGADRSMMLLESRSAMLKLSPLWCRRSRIFK